MGSVMSKKGNDDIAAPTAPPTPRGPLGPWKLSIAIGVSALFTGMALFDAATTGLGIDMALLRSFGVAFLTWIAVGILNRVLVGVPGVDDAADAPVADGDTLQRPTS